MKSFLGVVALSLITLQAVYSQFTFDRQPLADKGNGYYQNPIIPGSYADPSVIQVDSLYYMIHSHGSLRSGFLLWQSNDLVNWQPVVNIPTGEEYGRPWAPDLIHANGRYFIYVTLTQYSKDGSRSFDNYVLHADRIEGPWSAPVNLHIKGIIDPGLLVAKDGKRYLYFEKGKVVELTADGLATKGELQQVYDGWPIPEDWVIECPCLEGPKFIITPDYYYMISAMGGTAGPSTSHMATISRSKSPLGPWEESPYNPLIHTNSQQEKWWSQGHASILQAPDSTWWAIYHGYENGHRHLKRQTLLLPIVWTPDGWPVVKPGTAPDMLIATPGTPSPKNRHRNHLMPLSDTFHSPQLGIQWGLYPSLAGKIKTGNGKLLVPAAGNTLVDASMLSIAHTNKAFEVTVELEVDSSSEGGLVLGTTGVGLRKGNPTFNPLTTNEEERVAGRYPYSLVLYNNGVEQRVRPGEVPTDLPNRLFLKVRNYHQDVSVFYSLDGVQWRMLPRAFRQESLLPTLYAMKGGQVTFRKFTYTGLD